MVSRIVEKNTVKQGQYLSILLIVDFVFSILVYGISDETYINFD